MGSTYRPCVGSPSVSLQVLGFRVYGFGAEPPGEEGDELLPMRHKPRYGRMGEGKLPHSWRALRGWRKLRPGRSRKAMALAVCAAITIEMVRMGFLRMALFLMTALSTYSRPSELIRCRVFSLVPPMPGISEYWCLLLPPEERPERSKTGGSGFRGLEGLGFRV